MDSHVALGFALPIGLAITAFGLTSESFALALVFLALAGAADVISAVLRSGITQVETPDELRGRVMSIHILVVTSGPRLGDAEAALVAAIAGPQFSVGSGGLLCLAGLAVVVRAFPELLSYRAPAHAAAPSLGAGPDARGAPAVPHGETSDEIVRLPFALDGGEAEIDPPASPIDPPASEPAVASGTLQGPGAGSAS